MKRNYYRSLPDGKVCVVSCTTRRANHTEFVFGKFTYWPTKEDFEHGKCENAITYTNVFLGSALEPDIDYQAQKEVDSILKEVRL